MPKLGDLARFKLAGRLSRDVPERIRDAIIEVGALGDVQRGQLNDCIDAAFMEDEIDQKTALAAFELLDAIWEWHDQGRRTRYRRRGLR
jgi:hypothetical protein